MLARIWRGATRADDADEYVNYLRQTGLREYGATPGNRGVLPLRRIVDGRAEFLLLTFWENEDAVTAFAGDDISRAVFYPEDDRFLIDRGIRVEHFDVRVEERR
jgi:heme-degrading monooxygenase HmoA